MSRRFRLYAGPLFVHSTARHDPGASTGVRHYEIKSQFCYCTFKLDIITDTRDCTVHVVDSQVALFEPLGLRRPFTD